MIQGRPIRIRTPGPRPPGRAVIRTCVLLAVLLALARGETAEPVVLTNAQQVIALGPEGARAHPRPVRLRAVVTYPSAFVRNRVYVQDATAGIQVAVRTAAFRPAAGQVVDVEGTVEAGPFYNFVRDAELRWVRDGDLPVPRMVSPDQLAAGANFAQWVSVRGVVRDVSIHSGRLWMHVSSEARLFLAAVTLEGPTRLPEEWLGAVVELRGVTWPLFNTANQPSGFRFHVPGIPQVVFLRHAPDPRSDPPLSSAAELRSRSADSETLVRLSGVVIHASPSGILTLRDATGPFRVRMLSFLPRYSHGGQYLERPPPVMPVPGDRLECTGSPVAGIFLAPLVAHAELRLVEPGAPPAPRTLPGGAAVSGPWDAELIRLSGRLVDRTTRRTGTSVEQVLMLQDGEVRFEACLESAEPQPLPGEPGSRLEVTGACQVQPGELREVHAFRVLLRGPDDVRVLGHPPHPWAGATVRVAATSGLVLGVALAWVGLLRRQVARQTGALRTANDALRQEADERRRAEAEARRALVRERELGELKSRFVSMVSHEFRTPLEVIVSSADILDRYLDRLRPEERAGHLRSIQGSVRRMASMMEDVLLLARFERGRFQFRPDDLHLTAWCRRFLLEMGSATNRQCPLELAVDGLDPDPMVQADEGLLRHILTNLVSNAVKYSPAGSPVRLGIRRCGPAVVFDVVDRGCGIPLADQSRVFEAFHRGTNVGTIPGTGLGLVIVNRCVELHGGSLGFESREGEGSRFTVRLPLYASSAEAAGPGRATDAAV